MLLSGIRTFLERELWRLESLFPRGCMAECRQKCRQMDFSKTGESANHWYCWWPEVELNHRHTDFQSVALPTELSGHLRGRRDSNPRPPA